MKNILRIILILSTSSSIAGPTVVAFIDGPLVQSSTYAVASDEYKNAKVINFIDGKETSLGDLNKSFFQIYMSRYEKSDDRAAALLNIFHNGLVAHIALSGLNDVRALGVISPVLEEIDFSSFGVTEELIKTRFTERLRAHFNSVAHIFNEKEIRLANASIGYNAQYFESIVTKDKTLKEAGISSAKLMSWFYREYRDFLEKCPNTLFVFAAGNDGESIDFGLGISDSARLKNYLIVAGHDKDSGVLHKQSNFGKSKVDVAAPMDASHIIEGPKLIGTSLSAPQVTRVLAEMLSKSPEKEMAALRDELLEKHTIESLSLKNKVKGGRTIILENQKSIGVFTHPALSPQEAALENTRNTPCDRLLPPIKTILPW